MKLPKLNLKRASRTARLGKLAGVVGASYLGRKVKDTLFPSDDKEQSLSETHQKNAQRIATTFGELKGAVMKLGQMASMQSDLLPPEITDALASLQNAAPSMNYKDTADQFQKEFGAKPEAIFQSFEKEAFAAASIGQVHKGILSDGRAVAIKVQYPNIEEMLDDDLKTLKIILKLIARTQPGLDIDLIFEEIRQHLIEELDYSREAKNIAEFKSKLEPIDWIRIPCVIPEYSTRRILTMELMEGLSARDLTKEEYSQERRNLFANRFAELVVYQIFKLKLLHADPNLANFAIDSKDNIILYDFGCVKRFPGWFVDGLAQLVKDTFTDRRESIARDLQAIEITNADGSLISQEILNSYTNVLIIPFQLNTRFNFGASTIHTELLKLGFDQFKNSRVYNIPRHVVFINRVLSGMYGNFLKMHAEGDWGSYLRKYISIE